jgi:ABC-type branched-subunit amino acid transport system ATPase component
MRADNPQQGVAKAAGAAALHDGVMLRVLDVSKTFEGLRALDEVGFEVRTGHIKALIGPNGAGKTTLLNVINGLLVPDKGHVYFQGQDLVGMKTDRIAFLGLSRTFQLVRLFSVNDATVLDNVMIGAHKQLQPSIPGALFRRSQMNLKEKAAREKAMELLSFVGLEGTATMQPGALSFGNQRLVELARSLMADPRLLLLDEPASGLNDAEVESFMRLLSIIKGKGVTILLVEHNMKLVMNVSDDIVVLDFGRRLAEGPPAAICVNPKVIEAYLGTECIDARGPR